MQVLEFSKQICVNGLILECHVALAARCFHSKSVSRSLFQFLHHKKVGSAANYKQKGKRCIYCQICITSLSRHIHDNCFKICIFFLFNYRQLDKTNKYTKHHIIDVIRHNSSAASEILAMLQRKQLPEPYRWHNLERGERILGIKHYAAHH